MYLDHFIIGSALFLVLPDFGQSCETCSFGHWLPWSSCSETCGGGQRTRKRYVCCSTSFFYVYCTMTRCNVSESDILQTSPCNRTCQNGGLFENGRCNCSDGWNGSCCNTACSHGYFGDDCKQRCICDNGDCDHVTGNCTCWSGWVGQNCNRKCKNGYYGFDCQHQCRCQNGDCNHETGNCSCWHGWSGIYCTQSCLIGTFDQNCDRYCQCQNGNCDQVTGNCTCNLGWTGTTCNNFILLSLDFWKSTGQSIIWITVSSLVLLGTIAFIVKLRCHYNTQPRKQGVDNQGHVARSHTTNNYEGNPYHEWIETRGQQIDTQDNTLAHYEGLQYSGDNTEMSHYLTITHSDSVHPESVDNPCNGYESLQREVSGSHHVYSGINTNVH